MTRRPLPILLLISVLLLPACHDSSPTEPDQTPGWLQTLIAQIESESVQSSPGTIHSYRYRGETVYFVPERGCCDLYSTLYDRGGAIVCHPSGGIAGDGDGRCPDFQQRRSREKLIWQDTRV